MKRFQQTIEFNQDENHKAVSDDLNKSEIFKDNENEIVNNQMKKIRIGSNNKEVTVQCLKDK